MIRFSAADLLFLFVMAFVFYRARENKAGVELLNLTGVYVATFFSLHYFVRVAPVIQGFFFSPAELAPFFAFLVLAFLMILVFHFMRDGWKLILDKKLSEPLDEWGGMILAGMRGILLCGLLSIAIGLSQQPLWVSLVDKSLLGEGFRNLSVGLYKGTYGGLLRHLAPGEDMNELGISLIETRSKQKDITIPQGADGD